MAKMTQTEEDEVGPSANICADSEPQSFPDGGLEAWLVVLGSWCAALPSFGLMNTTGVFADWLTTHQLRAYSASEVSWIFSVHIFFLLVGGIQIGPIFDAYGPRYLLILGTIGLTAAVMVSSVSKEYYQFMLGFGVLGGISASMLFTPSIGCVNHWFFRRRALATAIIATAGSIGGIIFPLIFERIARTTGFPWAMRTIGFITLFFCSIGAGLQKGRLQPDRASRKSSRKTIDLRVLREVPFSLTTVAIIFADVGATIPLTYLTSYGRVQGMSNARSSQLMSIFNAVSILGRLMPGYAADRYGRFNAMIVTTCVSSILTLALWLKSAGNHPAIISYAALFGFWSGSAISLSPVCVAQISKTEDFGKRYGTTYIFVALGVLVAIPIAGQILKAQDGDTQDFSGLIIYCGLNYLMSFVFFVLSKGASTGWKAMEKF